MKWDESIKNSVENELQEKISTTAEIIKRQLDSEKEAAQRRVVRGSTG